MMIKNRLRLNLQFFAADDGGTGGQGQDDNPDDGQSQDDKGQDQQQDQTTYTQSDVDSAISKAVDKAIKNKRKEFEEEKQQAVEDAKKDAAEYAKLTKQQQQESDYDKRLKQLEERERELNMKQLQSEVEGDLKENSLPTSFAQSLITLEDNEKIKNVISDIKKEWDEQINKQVKEQLKQETPKGQGSKPSAVTSDKLHKMGYKERVKFKRENPETYEKLIKGE